MAEKISVQIALEGGQEIARQLEDIGEAGQKAFADIAKSAEQVGGFKQLDPGAVTEKLKAFGIEGTAAFEKIQQAVQKAARFESLTQGIATAENALLALGRAAVPVSAAIVAAISAATKATIGFAEEIQKASIEATKLGLTVDQFDRMRSTMEGLGTSSSTAGQAIRGFSQTLEQINIDKVNQAFKQLQALESAGIGPRGSQQLKTLQDAALGTGKAAELAAQRLKELGLAVPPNTISEQFQRISQSIAGLNREAQFNAVIQALAQIQDPAQQAALAMKFFGDSGAEVARKLQTLGPAAVTAKDAMAGLITPADAAKADALDSSINRLSTSFNRLGSVSFAGPITIALDAIATTLDKVNATASRTTFGGLVQGAALLNPIHATMQLIISALQNLSGTAQQSGQSMAQAGQQGAQAGQQIAQAGQTAFQAWQQGQLAVGPFGQSLSLVATQAQQAGQAGAQAGQQIATGMNTANQALQSTATQANATTQAVQQVKPPEASSWTSWGQTVIGVLQSAINKLLEWIGLQSKAGAGGSGGGGGDGVPGKARGGLIGGRGTGTSDSNLAWLSRGEFVMRAAAVQQFGAGFFAALNAGRFADGGLVGGGGTSIISGQGIDVIKQAIEANTAAIESQSDILATLAPKVDRVLQMVISLGLSVNSLERMQAELINSINQVLASVQDAVRNIASQIGNLSSAVKKREEGTRRKRADGRDDGPDYEKVIPERPFKDIEDRELRRRIFGFAPGGLIGGRGSGTSDSNLAWLSRGEFVVRAAMVRKFGSAFFAALNAGMIPGFALGGLVPRPTMAFAGGGPVGGGNHVTIQFPGVPPVGGLRASSAVVEELQRSAALAQVRSGGRKPSRYS
jgi:hypothetical protein